MFWAKLPRREPRAATQRTTFDDLAIGLLKAMLARNVAPEGRANSASGEAVHKTCDNPITIWAAVG